MSKNALVSLTIVLCVAAAGVGGYLATKSATTVSSGLSAAGASAPEASRPSQTPAAGAVEPPAPQASSASAQVAATEVQPVPDAPAPLRPVGTANRPMTKPAPAMTKSPLRTSGPADQPGPASAPAATSAAPAPADPQPPVPVPVTETPVPVVPPVETPAATTTPSVPEPQFDEVEVEADSVLGIKVDSTVHSETARIEDPVEAHVSRDLRIGSLVAVPAGTRVLGVVTQVERGGKMRNKSRLAIRFHTLVLPDGTRTTIQSEPVFREGEGPGQEAAGKVGAAAAGGALLGAILGGRKGAMIGGSVGAAGGTAAVMAGDRNAAVLKAGTSLTIRLVRPVTVLVAR